MKSTINLTVFLSILFASTLLYSQNNTDVFFTKANQFFKTSVSNGLINYNQIKKSPKELNELLKHANQVSVSKEDSNAYRAFWINMYNITVVKSVVENYPLKSPLDVAGFFDKTKHMVEGENVTLNDIENKLLRGQFNNDPRFHFVLVCAGLGCPPIINEAYLPNTLETQLNRQTKLALNNNDFIKVNAKKKRVGLSQIFEWYATDFTTKHHSYIKFINEYRSEKIPEKYKTSFYPYNWSLNATK